MSDYEFVLDVINEHLENITQKIVQLQLQLQKQQQQIQEPIPIQIQEEDPTIHCNQQVLGRLYNIEMVLFVLVLFYFAPRAFAALFRACRNGYEFAVRLYGKF